MNNQTMKNKKYLSFDQSKLKVLCDDLCDNIENLLEHFELEYKNNSKMISMTCLRLLFHHIGYVRQNGDVPCPLDCLGDLPLEFQRGAG